MRWRGICYRALPPQFASEPLSGEGARLKGGRFNRRGIPALYLATSIEGMILEQERGFHLPLLPLTICSYAVDVEDVFDLRTQALCAEIEIEFAHLGCAWREELGPGKTPASWIVAAKLIDFGAAGVLVPSFANGARPDMANLVLWKWGADRPHQVRVIDPYNQLPRDQSSWNARDPK